MFHRLRWAHLVKHALLGEHDFLRRNVDRRQFYFDQGQSGTIHVREVGKGSYTMFEIRNKLDGISSDLGHCLNTIVSCTAEGIAEIITLAVRNPASERDRSPQKLPQLLVGGANQ